MSSALGNLIFTFFIISFCIILISAGRTNTNEDSNVRNKRSYPSETLFPFPRVGRSKQFPMTWGILDEDGKIKREGLIPMGRNGRSGPKRNGGASNGGALWFGPRLGRSQKRGDSWSIDQLNPNFFQGTTNDMEEDKDTRFNEDSSEKISK